MNQGSERDGCTADLESLTQAGSHSGGAGICRPLREPEELSVPHPMVLKSRIQPGPGPASWVRHFHQLQLSTFNAPELS